MMNKIDIGIKKIFLDSDISYLNIDKKIDLEIIVNKNVEKKLVIVGTNDYILNIKLMENSKLTVNSINKNNSVNINIELNNNSSIVYNHSTLAECDSINNFNIYHDNNTTSILNNSGINLSDNKLFFEINGKIDKNLSNINCNQNSKIINYKNGNSKIIPNLIIDSNDISANHSAYIGKINEEEEFYLSSRGIRKEQIRKLIYKASMIGKMELHSEEEEFNQIINEWW